MISDLEQPKVTIEREGKKLKYECSCKGHPEPQADWASIPLPGLVDFNFSLFLFCQTRRKRLEKKMLSRIRRQRAHSRRGFSRKLWHFNQLANTTQNGSKATLNFDNITAVRAVKVF